MRVVDTSIGPVVLQDWAAYVADGLFRNSMGALAKKHSAAAVLLLGENVDPETVELATVEQLIVGMKEAGYL